MYHFISLVLGIELKEYNKIMSIHRETTIGYIHLTVSDLDRALGF